MCMDISAYSPHVLSALPLLETQLIKESIACWNLQHFWNSVTEEQVDYESQLLFAAKVRESTSSQTEFTSYLVFVIIITSLNSFFPELETSR